MGDLYREEDTYQIIGAAMEVYNEMGCELKEPVYQESLSIELDMRGIAWSREKQVLLYYKGRELKTKYRLDFVVFDDIIVEVKTLPKLTSKEDSQLLNYLKVTDFELGLLLNFGNSDRLEWKRIINRRTDRTDSNG
jgi:GxxExxY protein